jgi:hypothetical protein
MPGQFISLPLCQDVPLLNKAVGLFKPIVLRTIFTLSCMGEEEKEEP